MKRLGFMPALGVALGLSVLGTLLVKILSPLFAGALLARALCTALSLAYVLFLLARSGRRRGRLSLLVVWCFAALAIALLCPTLLSMSAAHLTIVWLARALLFHTSLLTALADLVLSALSLAAGCWALLVTGSLFASLWSLCLVQATCALLPGSAGRAPRIDGGHEQRFAAAARAAEQALRALAHSR
jgi:hypothetical protein